MLLGPPSLYSNFGASNNVINNGEGGGEGGSVEGGAGGDADARAANKENI